MTKVIIFNPRSANAKHRIPNSILQVGASIQGKFEYVIVDGNLERNPEKKIKEYLDSGEFKYFGSTVMPGPQLREAIPITKMIKAIFPDVVTIWGGYFASNQFKVCLESKYVDFIIDGPGDNAFPLLLEALDKKSNDFSAIKNIAYLKDGIPFKTAKEPLLEQDDLPPLPYRELNKFYPLQNYFGRTFLGNRTLAYHSSFGCPFTCSFCAVVPIYNARWKGKSAPKMVEDILKLKNEFSVDSVEFHDNNFFTSRKRVVEFSELVETEGLIWWGEGRIDTINKYSDDDLKLMHKAGCKMIFLGAETGNDEVLKRMDKGGTQSAKEIKDFVGRMAKVGIIPELSFVLGLPGENEEKVMSQIMEDIQFIKEIKNINPAAEIIIYLYSPVPTEGSELYEEIKRAGFSFPSNLDEWLSPSWEKFDLRKNPLTPWLTPKMVDKIRNFETVLNGYYPTVSDFRVKGLKKTILRMLSGWRYQTGFYKYPYEIKILQKLWKYRQPEEQGFYME